MDYTLGVDIGTTSVKTVLYDIHGKVHGYSNDGYPLYQDTPDMAEEDPEEIFFPRCRMGLPKSCGKRI